MTAVLKKKRYLVIILVPVLVVLVALSPFLLSSSSALHFFVTAVNKNISGSISIESWLIGWQQGVLFNNVVYNNPDKGLTVSIPSLTSNRGLVEFVLAPKNLGIVHLDSPLVELTGSSVQAFFTDGKIIASEDNNSLHSSADEMPIWDQVFVEFKSRDGVVNVKWVDQNVTLAFNNMSIDSTLAAGIATFEIDFNALDQGFVEATGSVNLPAHEYGWLETIIAETEMKVSSLQLRDFLHAGSAINKLPQGEGIVNADFQIRAVGLYDIEINGLAELTDVKLTGGFLGKDQPSFQKIHLTVEEGRWTDHGWSAEGLDLVSDTLNMKASGKFLSDITELSAQGILNLPVLFDQVPRFLCVNESTFVETGSLDFTVELNDNNPDASLKFKAKANNIGGIFQDQRFSWDSPAVLLFNGDKKGANLQVSALRVDAPFARAKGSGGLHSFSMDAVLDLDKAFNDIGTLFQIDLAGSGKMELTMKSDLAENEVGKFKVDADININNFKLNHHDQSIIPLNQFSLIGSLKAPNTYVDQGSGELDIQIVLSSWLGEVFLVMNGEKPEKGDFKGYYTTDSELDLGKITTLLHTFNVLDSETRMAGTMQLQAAGFAGDSSFEIRDLSAEITKFVLEGNGALFNEPRIMLNILQPINEDVPFLSVRELKVAKDKKGFFRNGAGLNLIDFSVRNFTLYNVQLEAKSGTATIDSLVISDWFEPYNGIRSQFSISADLEKMTEAFQAVGLLSRDTAFSGLSQATFFLTEKDELNQEMRMNVQIDGFGMKHLEKMLVEPKDVVFSSLLQGQVPFGSMTIDELKLQSGILNLDATGKISSIDEIQLLELSGSMTPVWDKIALIAGKEFDTDIKVMGQQEEQFIVKYPLWQKLSKSIAQLGVSSSFHADTVVFNGIEYHEVALPFHFDNSNLHAELSSRMGDGKVEVVTDIDFVSEQKVVKIPGNSQVMTGVKLDDLLVSKLFSKIHPLFGIFAQPSGLIDVRLDSFWWPINAKERNETNFVVIFDTREIQFKSQPLLKDILTTFGLEDETLRLLDNDIYCISNNDQTKCSPVRLLVGDAEITVGGVVYFDGSLDYKVEVPVTKKLVSDEGYRVLEGTTVKVTVKGTIKDPYFDKGEVTTNIQNLMKQAAEKIVLKN